MTKERLSEMALRNVRAWAANRPDMSGSQAIIDAVDELLERRAADEPTYKRGTLGTAHAYDADGNEVPVSEGMAAAISKDLAESIREPACRHTAAKGKAINGGLDSIVCECGVTLTALNRPAEPR